MARLSWTPDERRREANDAAGGCHLIRSDTRIEQREGLYRLTTPSCTSGSVNEVVRIRTPAIDNDADALERFVDATIAEYRQLGVEHKWLVAWDSSPNLAGVLKRRGLATWDAVAMTALVTDLRIQPSPIRVDRVDRDGLTEFARVMGEGWRLEPDGLEQACRLAFDRDPDGQRFFLARDGDTPIGVAAYVRRPNSATFTSAVVLQEHRGKGAYRALLSARLAAVRDEAVQLITTLARAATSAPILAQLGFEEAYGFRMFGDAPP